LTAKGIKQLQSADPNVVVEHNGSVPAAIVPIPMQPPQPALFQTEQVILSDFQTLAATNQYQFGNAPTKRTPTAEVEAIQSQGGARSKADQQDFEEFCANIAKDCLKWLQMYSVKTRSIPIYEDGVAQGFIDFTRDQIQGEYDIEVFVGSTTAPNDADRIQSIGFFMQSMMPLLQMLVPAQQAGLNLLPLVKQLLKSLPDIENVEEILKGMQPMPMLPGMGVSPPGGEVPPGAGGAMAGGDVGLLEGGSPPPEVLMSLLQGQL
jgi:hypothetical protein